MRLVLSSIAALTLGFGSALAAPEIDAPAPDFTGVTADGETVSLADLEGEKIVLEWFNNGCPFVQKHYESGNMQMTQEAALEDGFTWVTVISSAPGKQGHVTGAQAQEIAADWEMEPTHIVLDEEGTIGTAYGAKTTPHMYIIDEEGVLSYAGGIDSIPSADQADIEEAENYVLAALENMEAGEEIATKQSQPYGCSVKY